MPLSDPDASPLIVRSSAHAAWDGLLIEERHHPPGDYLFGDAHRLSISLELGPPVWLEHTGRGRRKKERVWSGQLHVVPVGAFISIQHTAPSPHVAVKIDGARFANMAHAMNLDPGRADVPQRFNLQDPMLKHCISALLEAIRAPMSPDPVYADGLLMAMTGHLLRSYADRAVEPAPKKVALPPVRLKRVIDYIEAHLTEKIRLADLARVAELSPAHFSTVFRKETGHPPQQFILKLRVEAAQARLLAGASVAEAAHATGFCDQSHLARNMKKILGVAPSAVRAAVGPRDRHRTAS